MAGSDGLEGWGGLDPSAQQVVAGSELAGYRIESALGRGGMGVVYCAHDLALDRKVALKLLAPELAEDVRFRERFLRESRLAASLDHPAIVPIYDAGEVAGQLYIAMRLVDGTDLKRLLAQEGKLNTERALGLVEQVADALDAAHERGLVHRDVKPSNVLIDQRGHCYLADFGLSRRLTDQPTGVGDGRSLGTVDYVAPEQIRGEELDGRADLYSLGCLLYECLAGGPPFGGSSDTAVVFAHLQEEPPVLPGLEPVMQKALAKEPDERYQSGRELVAAARDALRPARTRRGWLLATALVLTAAAGTIGGIVAFQSGNARGRAAKPPSISMTPNALNLIDARKHDLAGNVALGNQVKRPASGSDVVFSGRSAWLLLPGENGNGQRLLQVDVASRRVARVVKLPWTPAERIAVGGGMVWVREDPNLGKGVLGINTRSGRTQRRFEFGGTTSVGVAYGDGSLWLVNGVDVVRVDPRNGHVLHRFPAGADLVVFADGAVWAASGDGSVWKIDPIGNTIATHAKLHSFVSDLAVDGGSVWVSIVGENKVYQLSEADLGVEKAVPAGADPERITAGRGSVWVANTSAQAVSKLSESSGARTQFATGSKPTVLHVHDGLVWASAASGLPRLPAIAGEEIRISVPARKFNFDPVSRVFPMDEQLTAATCSSLLDYGPTGLRPEVAAAMPTISHDGRTYTFRIRPGFRFSPPSNEPVTAQTFRYTIERTLSPYSQDSFYAPAIEGLDAFVAAVKAKKPAHIAGIRAHGMTLSIRLAKPAGDFLARLAIPLFCPVPLSTPLDPARVTGTIAADGPYYFASVEGDRIVLLRNPNYAGHRPRRAARIVITDDVPTEKAVALVDNGQLDYLPFDFGDGTSLLGPQGELSRLYGPVSAAARSGRQRFYLHPQPMFDMVVFNTQRHLFRSLHRRQAVEFALDRPAMARAFWDTPVSERIVQVPGYGPGHVYPLSGPDLRRARRLVTSQRRRAVLLIAGDLGPYAAATVLRSNLARIGIAVRIVHDSGSDPRTVPAAFRKADMIIGTSVTCGPCERDPLPSFQSVLERSIWGTPLPAGPWSRPAFRRQLQRAALLRGQPRIEAYTRLEDEFARYAPVAVYGSFQYSEYFGVRVGCKRFQPFTQGVDLGSLCVTKT